jgi:Holliday junction resolvasome RuvABC endonuclease subunit
MKFFDGGLPRDVPVFIGIDQSYSGFSITALNGELYSTSVYTSQHRGIKRLADIKEYMVTNLSRYQILDVAIEGYAFGSQMANMLGELGGMVKLSLFDMGLYPLIVPPTSLKKYVTGKGTGVPKSQMLLQVYKKWGAEFTDDNAADSYSLARVVSGQHALSYEKDVYDKLQDPKFRER